MKRILIVSRLDKIDEYEDIAKRRDVAFEINDFFDPDVLDDEAMIDRMVEEYKRLGIPGGSTMHGVFYDIIPFSQDTRIREASLFRLRQSMEIASKLGVTGVVFHSNALPQLDNEEYNANVISGMTEAFEPLLRDFPGIEIYLENMFDASPDIMVSIAEQLKDYDNFGLCLDWAHVNVYGQDKKYWLDKVMPYVRHIHINDNDLKKDLHLSLGHGMIDWSFFGGRLRKEFADCSILIETNAPADQEESLNYLERILADNRTVSTVDVNEERTAEELLEVIFSYMRELSGERDIEKCMEKATDLGRILAGADRASFWCIDEKNKQLWTMAASGVERIYIPEGTGIVGAAMKEKKPIIINYPYSDARFNFSVDLETGYTTKSILCVPVFDDDNNAIGAYQVINKLGPDNIGFTDRDLNRLSLAANYCGEILESHLMRLKGMHDQLTGLMNRHGFYDYYEKNILNEASDSTIGLIMCDIDFFKKVNDTYGHNAGDAVLKQVAEILDEAGAPDGQAFRWGGEEFILLLPGQDVEKAAQKAECIRATVEASTCSFEGQDINFTMSFGVDAVNSELTIEENVKAVDTKLYEAKTTGRNKVVR